MKGSPAIKCMSILTELSQNTDVDLAKTTVLTIVCLLYMIEKLNKQEIIITFLLQFLQTYVQHLLASTMNFSLLNQTLTTLIVCRLNFYLLI